jgi:hypothetical protein
MIQSILWRRFAWIAAGIALGVAGALLARGAAIPNAPPARLGPQVWAVIAVPLATLAAAIAATPRRWPSAAGWIFVIYFFSLFGAARLERLLVGEQAATDAGHMLYFGLTIAIQALAGLVFAVRFSRSVAGGR